MIGRIVSFFGDAAQSKARRIQLWVMLLLVCGAVLAADFFVHRDHGHFFWDDIPGWWAGFGFVSCIAIILVSKFLGRQGRIKQDEDYYD